MHSALDLVARARRRLALLTGRQGWAPHGGIDAFAAAAGARSPAVASAPEA